MTQNDLYKSWTTNLGCHFAIDSDPTEAWEKLAAHMPCLRGPSILELGNPELRKLCHDEIDHGFFWWADEIQIKRDFDALR